MQARPLVLPEGLVEMVPVAERALLMLPNERVRVVGIGVVEKWDPSDLARKTEIEFELIERGETPQDAARLALAKLAAKGIVPKGIRVSRNILVNTGLTDYNNGLTTAGLATPYSNANAKIGAGDSTTAAAVGQTDLQAAAASGNRYIMSMDASYPTVSNGVATFRATFATGNGNFAWQEWAVTNSGSVGSGALTRILNRAVTSLGTKPSTQSWQFTVTITLA